MPKAFAGKQTAAEERAEARMVRSGKMTPAQYAAAEKREGDSKPKSELMARGKQLAGGKMSADSYASNAMPKMANGGMVRGYADGGMVMGYADGGAVDGLHRQYPGFEAPNAPCHTGGPGVRSLQDYKK